MRPAPRVPDGLTITLFPEEAANTKGAEVIMPDNGNCERFRRAVFDEFYRAAFRKKIYRTIDELQADLDAWLVEPTPSGPLVHRQDPDADLR